MGRKVMFVMVALLLLLNSCGKEEAPQMQEGRVSFSFVMEDGAGTKSVDENLIKNLNLYVVNSAGGVHHFAYLNNPGRVDATIWKDETYSVYVVANAGLPILKNTLNDVENIALTYFSTKPMPPSAILMSGKTDPKVLADGQKVVISLQRAMAKIVVKCDFSQLFPGVDLNIKSVRLRNVPNVISLFKQNALVYPSNSVAGFSVVDPTQQQLQQGLEFYQYENMQGTLLPGNTDQKLKVWPQGSPNSQLCSYVEIVANLVSAKHRGDMVYRFFLGTSDGDCNVLRNNDHRVTVTFKGSVSENENSVSVDNGALLDRVTEVRVAPSYIVFSQGLGKTHQCRLTVLPETAYDKRVTWYSSNKNIVKVDQNGLMTTVSPGYCEVYAKSVDNSKVQGMVMIDVR